MNDDDDELDRRKPMIIRVVAGILIIGLFVLFTDYFFVWLVSVMKK
jgi:hypothetical protein